MNRLLMLSIALLLLGPASAANANTFSAWSMNAGGCVPTDVDISLQGTHYFTVTGGMRIKHKGADINDIKLVCPVTALAATAGIPNTVVVYYANDGDGPSSDFSVTATLRSVAKSSGLYTANLCTATSSLTGSRWNSASCLFSGALDFDRNFYWVQLTVHRASTAFTPEINGVEIRYRIL